MSRHVIKFVYELPERETDACPACRSTDIFGNEEDVPEDFYCKNEWHLLEKEIALPAHYEICSRCKGEGTHTNPSIDGNGITSEEWNGPDWDDEEREMYMSGGYDVACEAGCSNGKVLVVDEALCKDEPLKTHLEAYNEREDANARSEAEDRRTRYYESGGTEGSRY